MNRREFIEGFAKTVAAFALPPTVLSSAVMAAPEGTSERRPKLPQRPLGRTGVKVSLLGLGGAGYLSRTKDQDAVTELLNAAIDGGINFFDTAPNYGRCEQNMGLVMGTPRRKEVFLATKVEDRTYDGVLKQVEGSLKALRTDYLDLLQIHGVWEQDDVKGFSGPQGMLTAMQRLQQEQVIRFIGMTGHPEYPQVKEALHQYDFDAFMCFINPLATTQPVYTDQLPLALQKKMGIIAMKVYGGNDPATLVGDGEGKAPAPLLLRYALEQPISVAIPAISSRAHLQQNLQVARAPVALSDAEREALIARLNPSPQA